MISNYKVKINDSCNYKVSITDIQNKYKFKLFCAGADLTDYYTKEQVDQSQNTQDILIDNLLNQIPTGTATGETINITDSSSLPLKDIQVAGNTYQANAILPSEYTQVDYIQSTGSQYIDTGINADTKLRVVLDIAFLTPTTPNQTVGAIRTGTPNKRYHLLGGYSTIAFWVNDTSYNIIQNSDTNRHLWDLNVPEGKVVLDNTTTTEIATNIDDVELSFWLFGRNSTGTKYKGQFKQWGCKMYYNGTLVRNFIPCYRNSDNEIGLYDLVNNVFYVNQGTGSFTYGSVASIPNPDYPQTISNVTGTNTIKIVGKNLFDKSNVNVLNAYFTATSPTITSSSSDRTIYIPCEPNTTYTISKNLVGYGRAVGYTSTIPAISSSVEGTINISANSSSGTITTGANANYLVMRAFNTGQDTLTYQQVLASIQVEKSSTVTTYEAYKEKNYTINLGDIELCKIGDYRDRIYYSSGKWYLEKNIDNFIISSSTPVYAINDNASGVNETSLNGSYAIQQAFYPSDVSNNSMYYTIGKYEVNSSATGNKSAQNNLSDNTFCMRQGNTKDRIYFKNSAFTGKTGTQIKDLLENQKIYYVKATPTTTEITDTTLKGQLDALINSTTYKTTTNITIDTTNQKPTLTLTYRKDLETLIGG